MPKKATSKTSTEYVDNEGIAARLKRLRLDLGLSQRELAVPGVSYAYISRIEAGTRNPSVKAIRRLAEKLGVTPEYLETGRDALIINESDPLYEVVELVLEALRVTDKPTAIELEVMAFLRKAEELRQPLARYRNAREMQLHKIAPLTRAIESYAKVSIALAAARNELIGALENAREANEG